MMIFFLDPREKVYARYGGRCERGPDRRQSLAGLRYTMQSVLNEHAAEKKRFAPASKGQPLHIRKLAPPQELHGCIHCHHAQEILNDKLAREGKWSVDSAFRYPPPDNLGLVLEVDRGNVARKVLAGSPAAAAGLLRGDVVTRLHQVPIHSFGDAQFALDRAPKKGSIEIAWKRSGRPMQGRITLPDRWRRTNIGWRPSLQNFVVAAGVYGKDLTLDERRTQGLSAQQLAFRQKENVSLQARKAGVRSGDIVVGLDGLKLEMRAYDFLLYVRNHYVQGETVTLEILREGKRLKLPMRLE